MGGLSRIGSAAAGAALAGIAARDLTQRRHAIRRNFPVVGRCRYLLEEIGPELRQYIVTSNDEERPFSRDQRRWVYASSKKEINTFGFGTDNDLENVQGGLLVLKQTTFPDAPPEKGTTGSAPEYLLPAAKVLGGAHGRRHAFRPVSLVNISGMSYGSLSPVAVEALNRGAALAPCLHNTGEGGLAPAHKNGGELIFQIGTGYFGCRGEDGRFSLERLRERIAEAPVRAIEIKLSQGAKPGLGGMLPGAKVSPEIAAIRGVPVGEDCVSPARHTAFGNPAELIEFVEMIAGDTGLPVGIKAAVGRMEFWEELAERMAATGAGPDYIAIDGAEGGTGAAPLTFSDHVAMPFKIGFSRVFATFARAGIADDVVFVGAGRLGLPDTALFAFALGADTVHVGREAMLAIGCIQAQRCHVGNCPTGVATQSRWLMRGLDPELKSARAANYVRALRGELLSLSRSCGVRHPALMTPDHVEIVGEGFATIRLEDVFHYEPEWREISADRAREIDALIGPPAGVGEPGPEGGPIAGDEADTGEHEQELASA
ncbi:MAG TPA: FMN-binding glutamate synthase family protein, partial [Solirubrobacteraceae bacterium]|nr:FMN-binding glutamate synthase family protein [Solirubrobacteraceae bacterium]